MVLISDKNGRGRRRLVTIPVELLLEVICRRPPLGIDLENQKEYEMMSGGLRAVH